MSRSRLRTTLVAAAIVALLTLGALAWATRYFAWMPPEDWSTGLDGGPLSLLLDAIRDSHVARDVGPLRATARLPDASWELIGGAGVNGSWPAEGFDKVRAMAVFGGRLVAGISGPELGSAQVWLWDGSLWTKIGGDGIAGSWGDKRRVNFLLTDEDKLYAGIGTAHLSGSAEVWDFDGQQWHQLGGAATHHLNGWPRERFDLPYSAAVHDHVLHVGMSTEDEAGHAVVMRLVDGRWEIMGGDGKFGSWDGEAGYRGVYDLAVFREQLYAGTWGDNRHAGSVWRFDGRQWQQVGGNGVKGSWRNRHITFVEDLVVHAERLVVSVQRSGLYRNGTSSVWSYDGTRWRQLGYSDSPTYARSTIFNYLIEHTGAFVLATGGTIGSAIWQLSETGEWVPLSQGPGGDAWVGRQVPLKRPADSHEWIYTMVSHHGALYAGVAGYDGAAQVWRYAPRTAHAWSR